MANGLRRLHAFLTVFAVGAATVRARFGFPDCVNGPLKNNAVCDVAKDPITRATALISIWTDVELTNNTGNSSPGVPRLGLPAYNWWSEGLVRISQSIHIATHSLIVKLSTAWPKARVWPLHRPEISVMRLPSPNLS